MYRNDRTGFFSDQGPNGLGSNVLCDRVHIGDYWDAAPHDCSAGRSDEGPGSRDNLVPRPYTEGIQRKLQCQSAVMECDGVIDPQIFGVLTFELTRFVTRPVVDFPRLKNFSDCLYLVLFKDGPT